jgi:hypothetical protein
LKIFILPVRFNGAFLASNRGIGKLLSGTGKYTDMDVERTAIILLKAFPSIGVRNSQEKWRLPFQLLMVEYTITPKLKQDAGRTPTIPTAWGKYVW